MDKKISMFKLLNERLTEEEIIKIVTSYDNKFNKLEEENARLNNIINELEKSINISLKEFEDNKDYFIDETTLKDLKNELQELKGSSEIEPVINDLVKMTEMCIEKDKEIERLNNIINEMEKMMKNDLEYVCSMNENGLFNGAIDILEDYLYKLQELKGSDKE